MPGGPIIEFGGIQMPSQSCRVLKESPVDLVIMPTSYDYYGELSTHVREW